MATISLPLLDSVRIAAPCSARWDDMTGDNITRHCADCKLNVHNLSAMTRVDAEAFLARTTEGRVCVRIFQRPDGTILTQDCPRGLAAARARLHRTLTRLAALLGLAVSAGTLAAIESTTNPDHRPLRTQQPFAWIASKLLPAPPPTPVTGAMMGKMIMGDMCIPPTPPSPAPQAPSTPAR